MGKQTYIGIDYSINSAAVAILRNKKFHFITYIKNNGMNEIVSDSLKHADVILRQREGVNISKLPYTESSALSLGDATELAEITVKSIKEIVKDDKDVKISIEGFSFGSTGMRLAQISGYQYILQYLLMKEFGIDSLYFYVPMTVKSVAGCSKKTENGKLSMIHQFANHDGLEMLPGLKDHKFLRAIKFNDTGMMTRTEKFKKPIDDICDSYWILYTMIVKNGWEIDGKTFQKCTK